MELKKITSFFLASVLCIGGSGIRAHAAENSRDGVVVMVSADKTDYDEGDIITAEVRLENNSGKDITDVTLEGAIPEGYHVQDDKSPILRATYIKSGDSIGSELFFVPDETEGDITEEVTETTAKQNTTSVTETVTASAASEVSTTTAFRPEKNTKNDADDNEIDVEAVTDSVENGDEKENPDHTAWLIAAGVVLLLAAGGVVFIIIRKKGKKTGIMILLFITAAGMMNMGQNAEAVGAEDKMSVSETVTVGGQSVELSATVRYTIEEEDMQAAVEEFYKDNSEEIVKVEDINETETVYSEKEVLSFMAERGFTDYPLTYDYNMDGTYTDEAEASADSEEKHPMYQTYFVGEDGSVWSIFIIGRSVIANPASYNLESDLDAQILVSETDTLTSYTEMGNKLYTTVPKDSAVILKVVDQITSQKLNELTYEEVIK